MTSTSAIEDTRSAWDRISAGYDAHVTDHNARLAQRVLERIEVGTGTRLLDVAAGTGAVAIPAARRGAAVTAVDLAPGMVDRLAARARSEGLANIRTLAMDGEHLDFDDDSFDVTASQFGVMLFPDLPAGLREMARVTRPGGTVVLVVFGAGPEEEEFISFFLAAAHTVDPSFDALPKGGVLPPFRLADRQALTRHMLDAGLGTVEIETVDHAVPLTASVSSADLIRVIANSNPMGAALVDRLAPDQRDEVSRVLDGMLLERATSGDPWLHNPVHIATGTPDRVGS